MDFAFTPEQEAYRQTIRDFIKRNCSPELDRQLEREERYPHELLPKLADTGILGVYFPEEYGGIGGTAIDFCLTPKSWPTAAKPHRLVTFCRSSSPAT
jgi:acyl-CoA dehydrogenase